MSMECGECERDLRGGHGPECSRYEPICGNQKPHPPHTWDDPTSDMSPLTCHGKAGRCRSCNGRGYHISFGQRGGDCKPCGGTGRIIPDASTWVAPTGEIGPAAFNPNTGGPSVGGSAMPQVQVHEVAQPDPVTVGHREPVHDPGGVDPETGHVPEERADFDYGVALQARQMHPDQPLGRIMHRYLTEEFYGPFEEGNWNCACGVQTRASRRGDLPDGWDSGGPHGGPRCPRCVANPPTFELLENARANFDAERGHHQQALWLLQDALTALGAPPATAFDKIPDLIRELRDSRKERVEDLEDENAELRRALEDRRGVLGSMDRAPVEIPQVWTDAQEHAMAIYVRVLKGDMPEPKDVCAAIALLTDTFREAENMAKVERSRANRLLHWLDYERQQAKAFQLEVQAREHRHAAHRSLDLFGMDGPDHAAAALAQHPPGAFPHVEEMLQDPGDDQDPDPPAVPLDALPLDLEPCPLEWCTVEIRSLGPDGGVPNARELRAKYPNCLWWWRITRPVAFETDAELKAREKSGEPVPQGGRIGVWGVASTQAAVLRALRAQAKAWTGCTEEHFLGWMPEHQNPTGKINVVQEWQG